jgi:hypothetical protein
MKKRSVSHGTWRSLPNTLQAQLLEQQVAASKSVEMVSFAAVSQ